MLNNILSYVRRGAVAVTALTFAVAPLVSNVSVSAQSVGTIFQVASGNSSTSTLVSLLQATALDGTLNGAGPFTVFAPTNDAFAKLSPAALGTLTDTANVNLLRDVLLYHVVPGNVSAAGARALVGTPGATVTTAQGDSVVITNPSGVLTINSSRVVVEDVPVDNGALHLIDTVLLSPALTTALTTAINAKYGTITDVVVATEGVSTLESLVIAAGLADDLATAGPFTVFAPTNAAFAKLSPQVISVLTNTANQQLLADILLYHVVSGNVNAAAARTLTTATSLQGGSLAISNPSGVLTINGNSIVTTTDIPAENGTIHLIDTVLLSSALTVRLNEAVLRAFPVSSSSSSSSSSTSSSRVSSSSSMSSSSSSSTTLIRTGGISDMQLPLLVTALIALALGAIKLVSSRRSSISQR